MMIVIGAVIIRPEGILLVREEVWSDTWIFPGGIREEGETNEVCLVRELAEELPGLVVEGFQHYGTFPGRVPKGEICLEVFKVDAQGRYDLGSGIAEAEFQAKPESLRLAEATRKAIAALRLEGCL